jgi:hypothetical protein
LTHQYNLKQIKTILEQNDLTIAKADKGTTMVIIHKEALTQKINNFIENQIIQLNKDPTDSFQKQIQQTIHKCNALIDKNQHKYLLQMKSMAPQLNALIEIHKEDKPNRPVINNIWHHHTSWPNILTKSSINTVTIHICRQKLKRSSTRSKQRPSQQSTKNSYLRHTRSICQFTYTQHNQHYQILARQKQ